eukprot:791727-Alexandrium_andersonii.AAC.1
MCIRDSVDGALREVVPGLVAETRREDERGAGAALHEEVLGQGAVVLHDAARGPVDAARRRISWCSEG